jgi:hypothetical protein
LWKSFAEEEPVRYAAAAVFPTKGGAQSSATKATAMSSRLVELDDGGNEVANVAHNVKSLSLHKKGHTKRVKKHSSDESGSISLLDLQ